MDPAAPAAPWVRRLVGALLLVGLAAMLTHLYAEDVVHGRRHPAMRAERHAEIVDHTGKSPYGYRVLVPYVAEGVARTGAGLGWGRGAREAGYLGVHFLATAAGLGLFHTMLRRRYAAGWAWAGTLLFTALHPASYRHYWYQPDSPPDLVVWLAAILLADRGSAGIGLVALCAVGGLNRETALFAPLLWAAVAWGRRPPREVVAWAVAALVGWAVAVGAVRAWVGPLERVVELAELFEANSSKSGRWSFVAAFLGVLWVLPAFVWRRGSPELRRLTVVLLPYIALQFVYGRWWEVRLFLPLAIVLVPWAIVAMREEE